MDETVTTFRELLVPIPGEEPGEAQRRASRLLPERLMRSPMDWWPVDAAPVGTGHRLLIGVAVWSGYDLRLLDLIEQAVRDGKGADIQVGVFDVDRLTSQADFERLIPGIGPAMQTPVIGYWTGRSLREHASGFEARQIVATLFGFDPKAALERPAATTK